MMVWIFLSSFQIWIFWGIYVKCWADKYMGYSHKIAIPKVSGLSGFQTGIAEAQTQWLIHCTGPHFWEVVEVEEMMDSR